jgi:hypothetical protein
MRKLMMTTAALAAVVGIATAAQAQDGYFAGKRST